MAEEIKQLVNQNFTGADMTNNNQFTLINNNSSTTSVVREVFVTGSDIASDKAKLFIDNNNIEVLDTFENAAGTMVIAPSQNMTMKLNTDLAPGSKNITTLDLRDWNQRGAGSSNDNYDTISEVVSFSATDSNFTLKSSAGTEGQTKTSGQFFQNNQNNTSAVNQGMTTNNRYGGFKVNSSTTVNFRVDSNSISNIYYNNNLLNSYNYSGPACDYVNGRIFWNSGGNIRMFDHNISTSSTYQVCSNFYSSTSTYGTGAVTYDHNGDLYYFYLRSNSCFARNITDHGNLTGGSHNTDSVQKSISMSGSNSATRRLVVAYNDSEQKFYFLHAYGAWSNWGNCMLTITYSAYNAASDSQGDPSKTIVKAGNTEANSLYSLFTAEHKAALNTSEYCWSMEHLGGGFVSFPAGQTEAYIYKCENNSLTFKFKLTGLTSTGSSSHHRLIIPKYESSRTGDISESTTAFTAADYDIEARVNIQGVEIT